MSVADDRYNHSEKGKARSVRYDGSEKGRARHARYYRALLETEDGRAKLDRKIQRQTRQRRGLRIAERRAMLDAYYRGGSLGA